MYILEKKNIPSQALVTILQNHMGQGDIVDLKKGYDIVYEAAANGL